MYQQVLDAAAVLQLHRSRLVADMEEGRRLDGVRVVAEGPSLNEQMMRESRRWTHLLSVRHLTTAPDLRTSLPNNRRTLESGLKMTSLFDWNATTPAARALLAGEAPGVYYFTRAPLQLKVVDLREVLLQGPPSQGRPCVIAVSEPVMLNHAMRYWHAVFTDAVPAWHDEEDQAGGFTGRQRRILELLRQDLTDQAVASVLGVSVRTVRYEVADIMARLGVRSRFSAGVRLGSVADE